MKSLTPKKVALAIGVSESSMKRWCDRGLVETVRTAGGHRRLSKASVVQFLREHDHRLVEPGLLGFPESTSPADISPDIAVGKLYEQLVRADAERARATVIEQYISGRTTGELFDEIIAPAFSRIGESWECGKIDVYHERRSCEICLTVMHELRDLLPEPKEGAPVAIGGAPEDDPYSIPTMMVDLVLREQGWRTESLGNNMPLKSFENAVKEFNPRLVWLSISHLENEQSFLEEYGSFVSSLDPSVWVVVGGQAANESIRSRMKFSAYCDNMRQLERFASSLKVN